MIVAKVMEGEGGEGRQHRGLRGEQERGVARCIAGSSGAGAAAAARRATLKEEREVTARGVKGRRGRERARNRVKIEGGLSTKSKTRAQHILVISIHMSRQHHRRPTWDSLDWILGTVPQPEDDLRQPAS